MNPLIRSRRQAVLRIAAFAFLPIATAAPAQDPRATAAQRAARDWIAMVDRGDAAASWAAASQLFRKSTDQPRWTAALPKVRGPLGAVQSRTLVSTRFFTQAPGFTEKGDYVMVVYRTAFEKRPGGSERVTLVREPDGSWRVAGYVVA